MRPYTVRIEICHETVIAAKSAQDAADYARLNYKTILHEDCPIRKVTLHPKELTPGRHLPPCLAAQQMQVTLPSSSSERNPMASLKDIYEQLIALDEHTGPTDACDTFRGSVIHAVVDKGWARVDDKGRYHVTVNGRRVANELRLGIRG